jgi:hypothetical protein
LQLVRFEMWRTCRRQYRTLRPLSECVVLCIASTALERGSGGSVPAFMLATSAADDDEFLGRLVILVYVSYRGTNQARCSECYNTVQAQEMLSHLAKEAVRGHPRSARSLDYPFERPRNPGSVSNGMALSKSGRSQQSPQNTRRLDRSRSRNRNE